RAAGGPAVLRQRLVQGQGHRAQRRPRRDRAVGALDDQLVGPGRVRRVARRRLAAGQLHLGTPDPLNANPPRRGCVDPRVRSSPHDILEAMPVLSKKLTAAVAVTALAAGATAATQVAGAAPNRPAAATVKLSASKTALKFNVKTLHAKHGKITLRMS